MKNMHGQTVLLSAAIALGLSLVVASPARAFEGPGCTGAGYITLPVGAKSIAMGETRAALGGDAFNWIASPGTMHLVREGGIGVFHAEWIADTRYDNISYQRRINDKLIVCGGFVYTYRPDIQGYDSYGTETKTLKSNNYQAVVGVGYTPVHTFTAAINIKYFREKLDEWSAGGGAVDLGALYAFDAPKIAFGVALQNIGPDIRYESDAEPLPLVIRAGASHTITAVPKKIDFSYAADIVKPRYESVYLSVGAEAQLYSMVALRAGYCGYEGRAGDGLTLGGGVSVGESMTIDYAYTPYGDLGTFHRIALFYSIH